MTRLESIEKQINTPTLLKLYKGKQCIKEILRFYKKNEKKLNDFDLDKFESHNFVAEVVNKSYIKQKESKVQQIVNRVYRLEIHVHSPEQNKIYFSLKNNEIIFYKVPSITTIEDAVLHIIKSHSIEGLNELIKGTKIINSVTH